MGCGASTKAKVADTNAEEIQEAKRQEAAEKIQAVWTARADGELKAVEDAVQAILQNLGTAVQNQDEAAVRYEIVQIQKLAPPTIALVRAHAGGRCIKVPAAAASALVQAVSALLDSGSGVPLGLLMSIERALEIFSWPGRKGDKVLKAGDEGNWTLDLGTESGAQKVWPRVRVRAATGRLIEVLSDMAKWRIDAATLALQELEAVCESGNGSDVTKANAAAFDACAFARSLLCPENLEVEFGQGIGWERQQVERQQVVLAATYHVGGDAAISKLLSGAADVIEGVTPEKFKQAWLLVWDGLVRSAAQLRPSLFLSTEEWNPGEEVRVLGQLECPEFNGHFGVTLGKDSIIQAAEEGTVCVRIGEALAALPTECLARESGSCGAGWKLQAAVRSFAAACEEDLLSWMTDWLNDRSEAAANPELQQPTLAPAMSSQFVSTKGRVPCMVCGTFLFSINGSCENTCIVCGASSLNTLAVSQAMGSLVRSHWQCPQCKELFDSWEDKDGEDGLLTHLQETGHGKSKGGKARYKVHLEKSSSREDLDDPLEEELQILRLFRLLPKSSSCDRSAFVQSVARRWSLLPEGSGNRRSFAVAANLCRSVPTDTDSEMLLPEVSDFRSTLNGCLSSGDFTEAWASWQSLSPVLLGLAAASQECQNFNHECRRRLLGMEDNFAALKEALLSVYDVPELLRGAILASDEYSNTLQRCRAAGELPESWDLGNLLDNNNKEPAPFVITLDKTGGTMLGIDVHIMETFVYIEKLAAEGLVKTWNENNPDEEVKSGDSIVCVNGVTGDGKKMSAELAKAQEMKITIKHGSQESPRSDEPLKNVHRNSSAGEVVGRKTLSDDRLVALFQNFVDKTWLNKWTHDRKGDPWGENVPSGFDVKEVVQVMNMKSWQGYLDVRRTIRSELPDNKAPSILADIDAAMTTEAGAQLVANYSVAGGALKKDLNEVWLWHGTKPMAADSIVASDFEISRAGTHFGTLYGNGIYLAEASIKADEYCRETNEKGWRSMLLCRCILGNYFYIPAETTAEDCENAVLKGPHHSVLGDRRKFRKTFREFVFMDHRQVYPCFLVFYTRRDAIPRPEPKKAPDKK